MSVQRPIRLPSPEFAQMELPMTEQACEFFWRVHDTGREVVHFSLNEAHRYSHALAPFPLLYMAERLETCLWERFGDDLLNSGAPVSRSLWMSRAISRIAVKGLRLCDLTSVQTRAVVRVDLSALHHPDLAVPQRWGLELQRHPAGFEGIRYASRFDHEPCVALFGRPGMAERLESRRVGLLGELPAADEFLLRHRIALI